MSELTHGGLGLAELAKAYVSEEFQFPKFQYAKLKTEFKAYNFNVNRPIEPVDVINVDYSQVELRTIARYTHSDIFYGDPLNPRLAMPVVNDAEDAIVMAALADAHLPHDSRPPTPSWDGLKFVHVHA